MDVSVLESFLQGWLKENPKLSAGAASLMSLVSIVDGVVIFDCVHLWANYQMKYLRGGLGTYADGLLAKIRPDIIEFKNERGVKELKIKWEFRYGDTVYLTRQNYY